MAPIPPGESEKHTVDEMLDKFLGSIQKQRGADWKRTKIEHGTINGLPFVRAEWSGTMREAPFKMHGFNYMSLIDNRVIQLSSQDAEPHEKPALALAEAAALTFQRATHEKPH